LNDFDEFSLATLYRFVMDIVNKIGPSSPQFFSNLPEDIAINFPDPPLLFPQFDTDDQHCNTPTPSLSQLPFDWPHFPLKAEIPEQPDATSTVADNVLSAAEG
jgi:hypothetical protein